MNFKKITFVILTSKHYSQMVSQRENLVAHDLLAIYSVCYSEILQLALFQLSFISLGNLTDYDMHSLPEFPFSVSFVC